jgi:hypothetical protein
MVLYIVPRIQQKRGECPTSCTPHQAPWTAHVNISNAYTELIAQNLIRGVDKEPTLASALKLRQLSPDEVPLISRPKFIDQEPVQ